MKKKHLIPILLLFVGLAALSFTTAAGVTLRLKPQQGKTQTITSKANMMTVIEVQGQSMNMSQVMETRQSFKATKVTDDQSVFETQIDAVKMTMSQMGMKFEYDSEHPEKTSPLIAGQTKEIDATLKKPITITYDALGNMVGDSIDLSMNQLGTAILQLPEKDLTVGSKWSNSRTQNVSNNEFKVNMEYTVTAISKKSIDVSFDGNIDSKDVTGTYNGTANINPQTGMVMSSTTKTNVSMTVNEQGMSLPMTVVGTTTVEIK